MCVGVAQIIAQCVGVFKDAWVAQSRCVPRICVWVSRRKIIMQRKWYFHNTRRSYERNARLCAALLLLLCKEHTFSNTFGTGRPCLPCDVWCVTFNFRTCQWRLWPFRGGVAFVNVCWQPRARARWSACANAAIQQCELCVWMVQVAGPCVCVTRSFVGGCSHINVSVRLVVCVFFGLFVCVTWTMFIENCRYVEKTRLTLCDRY